ncbi:MAG: hypothetical protein U5J78_03740 [Parasphingorhabdus sp.]|nr:hypothetical protein [Parasphingorhabdus sp.]
MVDCLLKLRRFVRLGGWQAASLALLYPVTAAHAQELRQDIGALPSPAVPAAAPATDEIGFSADKVVYDFDAEIVTASGAVVLKREGYQLFADMVTWNRKTGKVEANGNVRTG